MWWLDAQRKSVARKRPWYNMVMIHRRIRSGLEIMFCPSGLSLCSLSLLFKHKLLYGFQPHYYLISVNHISHCHSVIILILI